MSSDASSRNPSLLRIGTLLPHQTLHEPRSPISQRRSICRKLEIMCSARQQLSFQSRHVGEEFRSSIKERLPLLDTSPAQLDFSSEVLQRDL